ncbi:glycosyltransferase involved in cell wall biosynthesis [Desulfobaculum xiamenense]|uniref:Glycosyltransferase involved in cell wall biosynthesis n=1 Tax=Desulfobaculum xiamenense TaxID=995050 RepID=A0A846QGW5_9BACT|nr:glycosyltransferase family 4 protein [Desulfobaculum xiamenense]NJB67471.1 glycosyltransferase involved in cell wall biosynthesis [Desulfobaculum xiamenense]
MRIIQVVNVRWFNATSWYALFLSRLLMDAGHEVLVLALDGTETHAKALAWGLPVRTMPLNTANPLTITRLMRDISRLVDEFRPDVVNCHRGESFVLWGLLRTLSSRFRLVRTRGDQRLPRNNMPNRWLHATCADAVVSTNSVMHRHFLNTFGIPEKRLHLILGGVDRDVFAFTQKGRMTVRDRYGFDNSHHVIGLLGRFDEVKGQRELIEAVAAARKAGAQHLRLMLIGFETATSEAEVRGWIGHAEVDDITVITGKCPDVAACISACDVGVVASKWSETIARAALEFMSCGVPLVGTTVGVMPDLLDDEAMFPPADVPALAAMLTRTATDADFLSRIAARQAERIATLSGRDFLERTLAVYGGES